MKKHFLCLTLLGIAALANLVYAVDEDKPDSGNITDLKQTLVAIPHDLAIAVRNPATRETAATKATDVLRTEVVGHMATLTFKIDRIEKESRGAQNVDGYRVKAEDKHLQEVGTTFLTYLWVHFDVGENAKISALKKGGEISVTGKITEAPVTVTTTPALHIVLSDAKLN